MPPPEGAYASASPTHPPPPHSPCRPEFLYLWQINKFDWLVWIVSCLCTLFLVSGGMPWLAAWLAVGPGGRLVGWLPLLLLHSALLAPALVTTRPRRSHPSPHHHQPTTQGVEIGIGIGVGVSLILVIFRTAFPRITTLGRLPGTSIFRSNRQYPEVEEQPHLLLLRIDSPIWFANVENVKEFIRNNVDKKKRAGEVSGDTVRCVANSWGLGFVAGVLGVVAVGPQELPAPACPPPACAPAVYSPHTPLVRSWCLQGRCAGPVPRHRHRRHRHPLPR